MPKEACHSAAAGRRFRLLLGRQAAGTPETPRGVVEGLKGWRVGFLPCFEWESPWKSHGSFMVFDGTFGGVFFLMFLRDLLGFFVVLGGLMVSSKRDDVVDHCLLSKQAMKGYTSDWLGWPSIQIAINDGFQIAQWWGNLQKGCVQFPKKWGRRPQFTACIYGKLWSYIYRYI